jgi:cytosine/adenosine deaminase-related metal-dependent hydrolase
MPPILLTAAWVAPIVAPPMRDGGVVFRDGRIAAVGAASALRRDHPEAQVHDAGNAVILPGLINAHAHLELSGVQPGDPPARFVDWIIGLMGRSGTGSAVDNMQAGIDQCLRFGVTTVGDITTQPAVTRPVLSASPLRGISFGEVRAMAQRRGFLESRLAAAATPVGSGRIRCGISPHAPYSLEMPGYRRCLEQARQSGVALATHLAETADETEFLADHTGPLRQLWEVLNAWDADVPTFAGGPIRFARAIGLLEYPTLLAHVNYCDDDELDILAAGRASVVYCPRTHAFFGHPPHRWRQMLKRGLNVAVGTDSCASSPDLNLVDDLRLLHQIAPEIDPLELWPMVTTRAAAALGYADAGSLAVDNHADAAVFPVTGDDPLREVLESAVVPASVWISGKRC